MGHSKNSYTRYSVSVLSSNEGGVGFTNDVVPGGAPAGNSYDFFGTFDQAFQAGGLGVERLGGFVYVGQRPTYNQTSGGSALYGIGNEPFYRVGVNADLFFGKFELLPFFMHGYDNVYLGTSTASNATLPMGAQGPSWNGAFVEAHYYYSPQLVVIGRYELVRMQTQALP